MSVNAFRFFLPVLFGVTLLLNSFCSRSDSFHENEPEFAKGRIEKILSETEEDLIRERSGAKRKVQTAEVRILSGKFKDKVIVTEHRSGEDPSNDFIIHEGQRVLLEIEDADGVIQFFITDTERSWGLLYLTAFFFLLVVFISGKKGLLSLVSLLITGLLIGGVLIPAVMKGYPVLSVTIAVSLASTAATMLLISGTGLKSLSASIGTMFGVLVAGLVSYASILAVTLTGFTGEESSILWYLKPDLDLKGILAAGMIIGSLGAVMDVAMTIASAAQEIHLADPDTSFKDLFRSLMNVGKDIMGTMTNTLILAYTGSSLPLLLIASTVPLERVVNLNSVATEIAAALAGTIGIVSTVPLTAAFAAYVYKKGNSAPEADPYR